VPGLPAGRVILLNHFLRRRPDLRWCEEKLSGMRALSGIRMDVSLARVLQHKPLRVVRTETVNVLGCSRPVVCERVEVSPSGGRSSPRTSRRVYGADGTVTGWRKPNTT